LGIKEMTLTIYNRNGEEIFRATGEQPEWDGTYRGLPAPQGSYLVMIRAKATNGRTLNYSGNLTLIR
jgi:gliding motility-associated-like protein